MHKWYETIQLFKLDQFLVPLHVVQGGETLAGGAEVLLSEMKRTY